MSIADKTKRLRHLPATVKVTEPFSCTVRRGKRSSRSGAGNAEERTRHGQAQGHASGRESQVKRPRPLNGRSKESGAHPKRRCPESRSHDDSSGWCPEEGENGIGPKSQWLKPSGAEDCGTEDRGAKNSRAQGSRAFGAGSEGATAGAPCPQGSEP
jgi:hypothetical protein